MKPCIFDIEATDERTGQSIKFKVLEETTKYAYKEGERIGCEYFGHPVKVWITHIEEL